MTIGKSIRKVAKSKVVKEVGRGAKDAVKDASKGAQAVVKVGGKVVKEEGRGAKGTLKSAKSTARKIGSEVKKEVIELCSRFPIYSHLLKN